MLTGLLYAGVALGAAGGYFAYRTSTDVPHPPRSTPVPAGKVRICIAGYTMSPPTGRAHFLAGLIAKKYPDQYETWYFFDLFAWGKFTVEKFCNVPFPAHLKGHCTSPFVWFERPGSGSDNAIEPLGGYDHFSTWAKTTFKDRDEEIVAFASQAPGFGDLNHTRAGAPVQTAATA